MFKLSMYLLSALSLSYGFIDWMHIPLQMYITNNFSVRNSVCAKLWNAFSCTRCISFFSHNHLVMLCLLWHSPPGKKEEPYLTEAGREAFDKFYKLREGELQLFTNTVLQLPQLVLVKEPELVKDVLNVLIGVVSTTFSLNQVGKIFICPS